MPELLQKRLLMTIVAAGALLRLAVLLLLPDQNLPDADAYRSAGADLFGGALIQNPLVMPLYPLWSAVWGGGIGQLLADIALSTATIWLLARLSLAAFGDRLGALLAAAAAAIYPHFLFYATTALTETAYLFLLTLAFWLFYRQKMTWGSLVLVLSILMRPTLELVAPLLILCFALIVHRERLGRAMRHLGVYALIYVALMTPWWLHNLAKYDSFVRLSLGDGIVLYSGNNPMNRSGGGIGNVDVDLSQFQQYGDPIERNAAMKAAAVDYIVENPGRFVELAGLKFLRFWRLWPYAEGYTQPHIIAASLLSYGVMLFAAIGFLIRHGLDLWRPLAPMLLTAGYLTAVHMVTIGSIRYRFPLEGFVIILGCYWIANLNLTQRLTARLVPA